MLLMTTFNSAREICRDARAKFDRQLTVRNINSVMADGRLQRCRPHERFIARIWEAATLRMKKRCRISFFSFRIVSVIW